MESNGWSGSRGGRRFASSLQGILMLVLFTSRFQWAASERNESLLWFDNPQPWNKTYYKIERRCEDFHRREEVPSTRFYYWPEFDSHFDHCCHHPGLKSPNYTYGVYGPILAYGDYYDLGLIDRCSPYWKCRGLIQRLYSKVQYYYHCEVTDLQKLYCYRFLRQTVIKCGLLQSALPFILALEVFVVFFLAVYWSTGLSNEYIESNISKSVASKAWFEAILKTLVADWTHLCLLAIIGNGLIEAVGHRNPYDSASKSFYNYAQLYVGLTALVWLSSFLQQVSFGISKIEDHFEEFIRVFLRSPAPASSTSASSADQLFRHPSASRELEAKINLNADWKWQPIAAQAGILFCLGGYLTYVRADESPFFGLVVAAAGPWSGLYALRVIFSCIRFLFTMKSSIYEKLQAVRLQRIWRLWRRVMLVRKFQKLKGKETRTEEPTSLLRQMRESA